MAAPRFNAPKDSLAASYEAANAAQDAAFKALDAVTMDGVRPFGDAADLASSTLSMAHSLAIVLSNHLNDVGDGDASSRNIHIAGSIDAISHLVALADLASQSALREARAERVA